MYLYLATYIQCIPYHCVMDIPYHICYVFPVTLQGVILLSKLPRCEGYSMPTPSCLTSICPGLMSLWTIPRCEEHSTLYLSCLSSVSWRCCWYKNYKGVKDILYLNLNSVYCVKCYHNLWDQCISVVNDSNKAYIHFNLHEVIVICCAIMVKSSKCMWQKSLP